MKLLPQYMNKGHISYTDTTALTKSYETYFPSPLRVSARVALHVKTVNTCHNFSRLIKSSEVTIHCLHASGKVMAKQGEAVA